jgi:tryptophan synthase alpha chain
MSRIETKFKDLKKRNKKAFIAFISAGDPDLKTTADLVIALEKAGVDIVELGIPFSDPLADGPTIQASFERALKNGVTVEKILQTVNQIRKFSQVPIALMTSYNPVFHYGEEKFVKDAKAAGVDGVIIPDLPPEEAKTLIALSRKADFSTIFFLSPTTSSHRVARISNASTGFIYYVSLTGVTGARSTLPIDLIEKIKKAKRAVTKPVCVGFGISTVQQVKAISAVCDGVIVGSAIVKEIEKYRGQPDMVDRVAGFVKNLIG